MTAAFLWPSVACLKSGWFRISGDPPRAFSSLLSRPRPAGFATDLDAETRIRFEREAKITGRLQHPGIVPVHELGVNDEGHPFYVMKLLKFDPGTNPPQK